MKKRLQTPLRLFSVTAIATAATCALAAATAAAWQPVERIAFVGNSITVHDSSPEIRKRLGWTGNWGMAATSLENDYVHRLAARIAQKQNGKAPEISLIGRGGGTLKNVLANADKLAALASHADVVVIQLGENDRSNAEKDFYVPYRQIVEIAQKANPSVRIVCTGVWDPAGRGDRIKISQIKKICSEKRIFFADLSAASADPKNRASNVTPGLHEGVGWHPGDAGMDFYARTIFAALEAGDAAIPPPPPPPRPLPPPENAVLLSEDFSTSTSTSTTALPAAWTPARNGVVENGALKITNAKPETTVSVACKLPAAAATGYTLKVSGRVKAENISAPPNRWNGIKLMLIATDAEGYNEYPQAHFNTAATPSAVLNFDWREFSFTYRTPDNTAALSITAGLEKVTGTVWFDDVKVEIIQ
jgi:lysophospholipase L1-like esterase